MWVELRQSTIGPSTAKSRSSLLRFITAIDGSLSADYGQRSRFKYTLMGVRHPRTVENRHHGNAQSAVLPVGPVASTHAILTNRRPEAVTPPLGGVASPVRDDGQWRRPFGTLHDAGWAKVEAVRSWPYKTA